MPKPATFIALSMSIDQSKWYLAYSIMLIYFKIVILSVTLLQSITTYKLLLFRWLYQKVTLCLFLTKQNWIVADNQFTIVRCRSSCSTSISVFGWCIAEVRIIISRTILATTVSSAMHPARWSRWTTIILSAACLDKVPTVTPNDTSTTARNWIVCTASTGTTEGTQEWLFVGGKGTQNIWDYKLLRDFSPFVL